MGCNGSMIELTPEQESVLAGEQGQTLALALRTLAEYGRAFGAARLAPIASAHTSGTFGAITYKGYYRVLARLVESGLKVKVLTTGNPRPGQALSLPNRFVFRQQPRLEQSLLALGVTPNYSCVCYEDANVPRLGDRLAWAESSAVQFANSVLGARTNRNSILIDLCSAVTGLTPEFGLLLDENRRARLLVKLEIERMDPGALGYVLGQKAVDQVPALTHYPFNRIELKNLGGAMAASGAVAMFHVEGLTPEAPDLKTACHGEPETTITITQADLDALRSTHQDDANLIIFGCPQMTLDEAVGLAKFFEGRRVEKPTWFCLVPSALRAFKAMPLYQKVIEAGVTVHEYCPLAGLTVQLSRKRVLTPSGKLYYYLAGAEYGTVEDCLRQAGARP